MLWCHPAYWKNLPPNCSFLFVVLNYKSIPDAGPFCCGVNLPPNSNKFRIPNIPFQLVSTYVDFSSAPVVIVISGSPLSYLHWLWLLLLLLQTFLEDDTLYSSEHTADLSVGTASLKTYSFLSVAFFMNKNSMVFMEKGQITLRVTRSTTLVIHFVTFFNWLFFLFFLAQPLSLQIMNCTMCLALFCHLTVNWTYLITESKTENPSKYSFYRTFCGNYLL